MPRILDSYTDIAVYVYSCLEDAKRGEKQGGSGFLVAVPLEANPESGDVYVVTNAHVVLEAGTPVLRLNRSDGTTEFIETKRSDWIQHQHGDDVSAFPLSLDFSKLKLSVVLSNLFVSPDLMSYEDIGIGDDTFMVGRFIAHDGRQQNTPAVRFGNIAMMNMRILNPKTDLMQESFLVEVRSLPGYSGSAVYIHSPGAMNDMSERRFGKTRAERLENRKRTPNLGLQLLDTEPLTPKGPYLLGIDWCHLYNETPVLDNEGRRIGSVRENTGMAGVIPAWKISELLNCEEFSSMRRRNDEELTKEKASG